MDAFQAGQQLGTLLFGSRGSTSNPDGTPSLYDAATGNVAPGTTYYNTLKTGSNAMQAFQDARDARTKAMIDQGRLTHRQSVPASVQQVYSDPNQAALVSNVMLSNNNPSMTQAGVWQNPNALPAYTKAAADMNAGNFAGYNQQTALAGGKPYEPVRVVDSTMLPSGVPLGDAAFTAQPTPAGSATIGLRGAETLAAQALAGQREAKTNAINNPKAGKAPKVAAATRTVLEALMPPGTDAAGAALPLDVPRAMARYKAAVDAGALTVPDILQWNAAHPALGNPGPAPAAATGINFVTPPPAQTLGDAAIGAPAPGTTVRTNPADAAGAAAANALASVDPSPALPQAQRARFNADPRVVTLQQQATKAITVGHADPARVAAKLQQEYAAIGYTSGAGGG